MKNLFNKKQLVESKITLEELLNSNDDICVIVPKFTIYFSMWYFNLQKKKYAYQLSIIKKYIELHKRYYYVNQKKNDIDNYIMPLEDAKIIINAVKNNIGLKQINIVNIFKSDFEQFESNINKEFYKLERIKKLKAKRYLTIVEKKELISYGEQVPICVYNSYIPNKSVYGILPFYSIYQNMPINLNENKPTLVRKHK